jgi:putative nucleotidyltransferase with HDIG domain
MDRDQALAIVHEYVSSASLVNHMLAAEAAMRSYAPDYGGNPDEWGLAGLLHDFDWEIHPTLDQHPQAGAPILRSRNVPEAIVRCILSHADHTGVSRSTSMEKALYACDEITGLVTAVALVRPSRSLHDLTARSVRKKWGDLRFAAAIDRMQIERAAQELGVELWGHVDRVIAAMRTIAAQLGLEGTNAGA